MRPASSSPLAGPADFAACRALLRGGSRSFLAASLLLPRRVREPAAALYAFCRVADDAIDLCGAVASLDDTLSQLRDRLDRAYEGRPAEYPTDRALADVVARFALPRALLDALLEGFEWDASGRRYEDLPALNAYAARVAGSVGAMMAVLMGARSPALVARACDLGTAMQLTNIARDVGEDARAGRLYLPVEWLREAGVDPDAWLVRPVFTDALGGVVERLLRAADALYTRADAGIAGLPFGCRPGIRAARHLYAEIGHEVARQGFDSTTTRAVVSTQRKIHLLGRALITKSRVAQSLSAPSLPEAGFLVAASAAPLAALPRRSLWGRLDDRIAWAVELFERLERLDLAEGARSGAVEPSRVALSGSSPGR
jgi:15-cis-phytoene synthase